MLSQDFYKLPAVLFLLLLFQVLLYSQSNQVFYPENKSPQIIGKKITEELLSRPDYMIYKTDYCTSIHYAEVCAAFGALRLAGLLDDTLLLERIYSRYKYLADSGPVNTANHVDANVYGILPLELYKYFKEEKLLKEGLTFADGQWAYPLPDGLSDQTRYWIDDIWMIGSLQVQAFRITGDTIYINRAALELEAYLKKLQQPNGLFRHGNISPFYWGRGNGWVAAGLAEVLSVLPQSNSRYTAIHDAYLKMMQTLLLYQGNNGMWNQLVDVDTSFEESSCTAMFAYAMALGVKKQFLTGKEYETAYQKAWLVLCDKIDETGKLNGICVGTGQGDDINYYLTRPVHKGDFHGQAPMLWLAYSLMLD